MGLNNFQIIFDSPTNAFYAGTNVTGRVELIIDKPIKVGALSIKFVGAAKVQWTDSEDVEQNNDQTRTVNIFYVGEEEYYSFHYNLVGGGNRELEIRAGIHVYPFSASLPPGIPSSFEGELGYVRYTVTATLDRPNELDQSVSAAFQVVSPIDLNFNLKAKEPVKLELEKNFCCCCCKSGPLQLVFSMPFAGFVPGQSVPLTIEVDNASNVEINNVTIILNKVLKWKARVPSTKERKETIEFSKLTLEGVKPNGSKSWTEILPIPNIPPINLDQCTVINCNYNITVTATVSGCHGNLTTDIPVFLGTVPIHQAGMTQQPNPKSGRGPVYPSALQIPATSPTGLTVDSNRDPNPGLYSSKITPMLFQPNAPAAD